MLIRHTLCLAATAAACAAPVINEVMFHPAGVPENRAQEWIEIHNPDAAPADVGGWKITRGVSFTIPPATVIPAGGFLVIAADVAAFDAANPGFTGSRIGGWTGTLANGGEQVQLEDAAGVKVCDFSYADEGEWAVRGRGELSFGHRGWAWFCPADGGGSSLELRTPALGTGSGQNWASSTVVGGTPGAVNSTALADAAPLIKNAKHRPEIPRSTDPVTVSCEIEDELPGATATLRWRLDGGAIFDALPMTDADGDGDVEAVIPAQANLAVIEWYIEATDGANTRTWPAPARTSNPGVLPETFGQVTNALVQVDDAFDPAAEFRSAGNQPLYRLIMTDAERQELAQIGSTSGQEDSTAEMNGTFISHDGTGVKTRFLCGFRNRGFGSALGPPNNYHVSFRNDDRWNGRGSIALNCQYPHSQALGQALFARAGLATQDSAVVRVRVNGANLAQSGSLMYGRYVRIEARDADWVEHHFPNDPDGNFYRLDDHDTGGSNPPGDLGSGEFRYEGTNAEAYSDTFHKETNKDVFDYTDLINLTRIVSAPVTGGTAEQPAISDAEYPAAVASVLDLDNFYRYFATDALVGNQEGGLQSGRADDASIYRGVLDPRFKFVPHDLDDVFDIGNGAGNPVTRSIFSYDFSFGGSTPGTGVLGLTRMFNHPQLVPRYYAAVLDAMNSWFNSATVDPIVDQIMAGWVPAGTIAAIKNFVTQRRANVLAQIQQNYALTVTGNAPDSAEGYKVTTTGAAAFSGTFNVARTYSITVNGTLATWSYRDTGTAAGNDDAGEWFLNVPAGGGTVLSPGLNRVIVQFWDGPGGTGGVVRELSSDVLFDTAGGTTVSGTLSPPGSISMLAPESYVPGVPILVRVDLKDSTGALNRSAWNTTVNLTATNGIVLNPNTVTLFNGMGSALVSVGGGGSGGTVDYFTYGSGGTGSTTVTTGTPGGIWKSKTDFTQTTLAQFITNFGTTWKDEGFDDSTWVSLPTQTGYGDGDENRAFPRVDYSAATAGIQSGPVYLFRSTFNVADPGALASVSGQVKFDDSCAVYVNGTQVYRHGDLTANAPLTEYTETTTATTRENATANFTVPLALLHTGANTIAVEVHQHDAGSSDVTFDLRLQGSLTASDPGNFTLTAATGGLSASKALASLGPTAPTHVSGTLPAGTTTWSGVIAVTGDVTVPSGSTLEIAAGTHVLMAATAAPGDTSGADIIVSGGTLTVSGTAAQPVSITAADPLGRWGQIYLNGAQPTVANFLLMSRGGHAPGQGHTGRGPMWRLNGSHLTFDDSAMGDAPAKALYSAGTCDFVMRRSLMARMITGPETENGTAILIEDSNIQEILPHYRESNAATPDDEDCLYVHNSSGRPVNIRRSVFALCGDDVFDCLGGPIHVEDAILRQGWDKGMSLLNNDLTITRTLIVDCDKAIVPKSQNADTRTVIADRCTIHSENHDTTLAPWGYSIPPASPDADTPSAGFYTQNKSGQSNAAAILSVVAKNCIILAESPVLVDAPYDPAHTVVTYSITRDTDTPATPAWPGVGNLNDNPLFISLANDDYHLAAGSPAIDSGDPADTDPDGSRADMGGLPSGVTGGGGAGEVVWSPAGSPYRITANTTVPPALTLRIQPGVSVWFNKGARLTVNGRILAEGSASRRIVFSHVPGSVDTGDCDPIKLGIQTGPPKWGGIRVVDSMAQENVFKNCDFINAQGTSPLGSENYGSLGHIRSWGYIEGCTWSGTHLRMCYGRNSKLTLYRNTFPDMFIFDPVLGRIEEPTTDFIAAADNNMEPLKVEFPTTDAEVSGANAANFPNGLPLNGHWRCYFNSFHGNRGHQDVFDCDSGRWAPRDASGNQTNGQFILDCRYNHFFGLTGDEHIDLGGDAYIASNVFENATKDVWTNDTGYSNAISSGDKGTGTTILLARNVCYDLDHVINLKAGTATIFEHNTVANIHADFQFAGSTFTQNVLCAPINFFVPGDGPSPSNGDGAYLGFNIISNVPRVFSSPDQSSSGPVTTKIEFFHNLLDQIADPEIGPNHPGGYFSGAYGPNTAGAPGFVNTAAEDYSLLPESPARGSTIHGFDFGAGIPEWAYIAGGPRGTTASTGASFIIGGPGIVAYKWRLDGGAWSAPVQIGDGGLFPRTNPCVRQSTLTLSGLGAGAHTLEVLGQDMAGNWQDADPARTIAGLPQAAPTVRTWTVDPAFVAVRLSEILADAAGQPDSAELENISGAPVNLTGWSLTDDPLVPGKFPLSGTVPAGGFAVFSGGALTLDKDGDTLLLYQGGTLRDSVTFGQQVTGTPLVRHPATGAWTLGAPTPGAPNTTLPVADSSAVTISEWFASGDVLYESDWIELRNANASPALLTGLRVTDNRPGDDSAYVFPPLSFIAGGGFVRLVADRSNTPGHLPFAFDAEYEVLSLITAAGALQDTIAFYPQTTDWSQGRDAGGVLTFYELPTRGFTNGTGDPAYANALAILRHLRISELMYHALGGSDFDYVELTNTGATPLELGGARFVQGISFTFPPLTLNPGGHVVVAKHLSRFTARYGTGPLVAGTYGGQLDNGGETLGLQLPPPYDANILTFDYDDDWHLSTDGAGTALLVSSPATTPAHDWDDRDTWSTTIPGGQPAGFGARTDTFSGWMTLNAAPAVHTDDDLDTVPALVEFSLGMDPADALGANGPAGLPVESLDATGHARLTFLVPENPLAAQGHGFADVQLSVLATSDVTGPWTAIATKTFSTAWTGSVSLGAPAGGYIPVTVTDAAGPVGGRRFLMLQATWLP